SMRVPLFLNECQIPFDTLVHPPAFTAHHRAKYLNVPGKQLAKCVLLTGAGRRVLAILPAIHQVDTEAVSRVLGGWYRLSTDGEVSEIFRDCEWGALAPFGSLYGIDTILDEAIASQAWIIFQAHAHAVAIRMYCRDFKRLEKPRGFSFGK